VGLGQKSSKISWLLLPHPVLQYRITLANGDTRFLCRAIVRFKHICGK
jgi:hypothetical protein